MDPFSLSAGTIGIAGVAGQFMHSARNFKYDYCKAGQQKRHAQNQVEMLHSNLQDPALQRKLIGLGAKSSLQAISESFPDELRSSSNRARLLWAWKHKKQSSELINQLKDIEISASLALQLGQSQELENLKSLLSNIQEDFESIPFQIQEHVESVLSDIRGQLAVFMKQQLCEERSYVPSDCQLSDTSRRHCSVSPTAIKPWKSWMVDCFGTHVCLLKSEADGESRFKALLRLSSLYCIVMSGIIPNGWSSWLSWSLYPQLILQNIIRTDSPAVEACCKNDIPQLRSLLSSGWVRPNDVTEERLTLLHLSIRESCFETTKLLLDSGADPNLTCGKWETSPLDGAFYVGDVRTVRLLLALGAELDYVNRRPWTAAHYLFDPELSKLDAIELMDICAEKGFDNWNSRDMKGWTIVHRAAAFGRAKDLRKLRHLHAAMNIYTSPLKWLPISCAVYYGNESAFGFLVELISPWDLSTIVDSRGWNLLHLAAKNGSETLMTRLLKLQVDSLAKTDESSLGLPEGLAMKELTVVDIAQYFDHQDAYERASRISGKSQ